RTLRVPRPALRVARPAYGLAALGALVVGCVALVVFATAGPSILVPGSYYAFPSWVAGPLRGVFGHLISSPSALSYGFSALIVAMTVAYGIALAAVRALSMGTIVIAVVALHAVVLLSPPLQLTDLFNYLGYARLGALHHLNPYTHVIAAEHLDPVYGMTSWHHLRSPYGYAFTLLTYPLGLLPLPVAYWVLKTATVLASLGFIALVWRCARQLGRDPRFAVLFVAANPLFWIYELGGFHNDVFMLLPAIASISLLLDGRDRWSGATLMLAIGVKFTMVLLLPFLLLAARPPRRRARFLTGAALGAAPLAAMSVAAFGFAAPNLSAQTSLLTPFSVPNLVGLMLGLGGGAPGLLRLAAVAPVAIVAIMVVRVRRGRCDWLAAAGVAMLGLLACLAWLTPWYIVWVLPLAALGSSIRLRRAALASTLFLVLSFVPATATILSQVGLNPMNTPIGRAVNADAMRLAE
ncbi:MAG: DUF2029 domain-containing protein, partial [Actinomycetota bacterium]|nr:DUF2029 domain-containing protein [Actinomycetota bacterium]